MDTRRMAKHHQDYSCGGPDRRNPLYPRDHSFLKAIREKGRLSATHPLVRSAYPAFFFPCYYQNVPKFLYTIIGITILFWYLWIKKLLDSKPNSQLNIATFLIILFVALALTLSLILYFYFHKKAKNFSNLRFLYRKGLKWGTFFSFGIVGYLAMRAFNIDTLLNTGLFLTLYIAL